MNSTPTKHWVCVAWLLVLCSLSFFLPVWAGQIFVDDAYITFRYAENIADGKGFVYNSSEKVMGTTTPLYTFLLAILYTLGINILKTAYILGITFSSIASILVFLIFRHLKRPELGMVSSLLLCVLSPWLLATVSGMETNLYASLLLFAFLLFLQNHYIATAVVTGLACLTRPDGIALVVLLLPFILIKGRKPASAYLFSLTLTVLPWLVFAWIYFGSFVPHTVAVKKLIHPAHWLFVLFEFGQRSIEHPGLICLTLFFIAGLVAVIFIHRELRLIAGWIILYISGYSATQVMTSGFPWYFAALMPFIVIIATAGIDFLLRLWQSPWKWMIPLCLISLSTIYLIPAVKTSQQAMIHRESVYQQTALWILRDSAPGDRIYAGEIGTLGYYLKNRYIIDSSGLTSLFVHAMRKLDKETLINQLPEAKWYPEGTPQWSINIITRYQPEYITSREMWLHLPTIIHTVDFQKHYIKVLNPDLNIGGNVVYKRKRSDLKSECLTIEATRFEARWNIPGSESQDLRTRTQN